MYDFRREIIVTVCSKNKERINLVPQVINSGHFNTAEDCCWDRHSGRYLLSVSSDQTTRLHAEWKRDKVCLFFL